MSDKQSKWERMLSQLPKAASIDFWRELNPDFPITDNPFQAAFPASVPESDELQQYRDQMLDEAYFQTGVTLPPEMLARMREVIESVRAAGLPLSFAYVYDIFYEGLAYFHPSFESVLGANYRLVPNLAVYYIEPTEQGKGYAPHRDAEYANAVDENGMPTVLTVWITVTEATTLNSCLYVVPKHRDPEYDMSISDLSVMANAFAWEDVRALPTPAGVMSCWSQYLFHWGSRASQRAKEPRITYAVYLQSGNVADVENQTVTVPGTLTFEQRLAMICYSVRHNNTASVAGLERADEFLGFLDRYALAAR